MLRSTVRSSCLRPSIRLTSKRFLATAAISVINPSTTSVADFVNTHKQKLAFEPAAAIVAVTPQYSESLLDFVVDPTIAAKGLTAVGAAVDALGFGAQRSAMSVLFFDKAFEVTDAHVLDQEFGDDGKRLGRSGADLTNKGIVSARRTWHTAQGFLSLRMGGAKKTEVAVPLANTLFTSGLPSTLVVNKGHDLAGVLLSSIQLEVPGSLSIQSQAAAAPLLDIGSGAQFVTDSKSNLIKTIDNKSAAFFLESSKTLMEFNPRLHSGTGEKKVFALLTSKDDTTGEVTKQRFEVTAGGGGAWSPRASMLVLEPQARPLPGMGIQFSLAKDVLIGGPGDYQSFLESQGLSISAAAADTQSVSDLTASKIVLGCAPVLEFEHEQDLVKYGPDSVMPGMFSLASEQGFLLNDSKYSVPGEVIQLNL